MVPWLVNRQGIELEEAARGLDVTVEQLESDLNLLFLCGYGQMPDELIEADWEEGRVFVGNADTISRPLRLGVDEAVTLIVGLRTLLDVPGPHRAGRHRAGAGQARDRIRDGCRSRRPCLRRPRGGACRRHRRWPAPARASSSTAAST